MTRTGLSSATGAAVGLLAGLVPAFAQEAPPRAGLPAYEPVRGLSGLLRCEGSDTMEATLGYWAERFRLMYPDVRVEIGSKGSSSAPPVLIVGSASFGAMSRPMKAVELDCFRAKFGYEPTALRTSIDMLAVFVHADNPIRGLSLQELDAIFSKSRRGGAARSLRTWGDLGLTGEWADREIRLYGRAYTSGTHQYFREKALFGGDFRDGVEELPDGGALVRGIERDPCGIGYGGMAYRTAGVRAVPLCRADGPYVEPAAERAYAGTYPLARYLFLYVNHRPGSELDPLRREFIRYAFSREGQADVQRAGLVPVTARTARDECATVGLVLALDQAETAR